MAGIKLQLNNNNSRRVLCYYSANVLDPSEYDVWSLETFLFWDASQQLQKMMFFSDFLPEPIKE